MVYAKNAFVSVACALILGLVGGVASAETPRVEIRGGQGEARPAASTETITAATAGQASESSSTAYGNKRYGPLTTRDTLWSIANRVKPSARVSVYQTIIALYDNNPGSFEGGNINRLRPGAYLKLPSESDAAAVGKNEAVTRFNALSRGKDNRKVVAVAAKGEPVEAVMEALAEHAGLAALPSSAVRAVPGRGTEGEVDGQSYLVGSLRWMQELGVDLGALAHEVERALREAEPARETRVDRCRPGVDEGGAGHPQFDLGNAAGLKADAGQAIGFLCGGDAAVSSVAATDRGRKASDRGSAVRLGFLPRTHQPGVGSAKLGLRRFDDETAANRVIRLRKQLGAFAEGCQRHGVGMVGQAFVQ